MQLSLRSQMIAGTALVGASAIALTPVAPAVNLPAITAPSLAQVALAGFDSPLTELLNTSVVATNYLFSNASPLDADQWPFANFGNTFGVPPANYPLLPGALVSPSAGGYSSVGLIPQIIDDALPIISQLGYNGTDYLQVASTGLYGAAYSLSEGVWNLPGGVIDAVGELIGGDPSAAIQTLFNAVVGPIIEAGTYLLASGGYVLTGVVTRASALIGSIPDIVTGLIGTAIGIPSVLIGQTVDIVSNVVSNLLSFNLEGAWNSAVNGLLGPSGLPGSIINLTIGAGVQTGPITSPTPGGVAASFVPSVRTAVQTLVKTIAGDLATPVPTSAAAVSPAAARAAVAAPAASVEAAPAADAAAGDSAPSAATARAAAEPAAAESAAAPDASAAGASAPGDSAAGDNDATTAKADAPAKGKAAAGRGGRS